MRDQLKQMLIHHEGYRGEPYLDSRGYTTIGIGRCLDFKPLTFSEALHLLDNDIDDAEEAMREFSWYDNLSDPRKMVVISMVFNLGLHGFKKFKKMIAALEGGDYETASKEMLDSQWSVQVGRRARDLSRLMYAGMHNSP
jgi:lysozyme